MKITRKDVEHVALLARLRLSEEEIQRYTDQLDSILEYAAKLEEIDTSQVEPTAHAVDLFNVMREDEVKLSMPQANVLANAPEADEGFFRVPKIV